MNLIKSDSKVQDLLKRADQASLDAAKTLKSASISIDKARKLP